MRSRDDATAHEKDRPHRSLARRPCPAVLQAAGRPIGRERAGPRTPAGRRSRQRSRRPKRLAAVPGQTTEVHHMPASASLSARGRTGSRGSPHRGVSSRTGMEPALQRRRGVRGHRRPASRWPEHPAAPAGPPEGDRPSAPAATAGDSQRRRRGELTCARPPSTSPPRPPPPADRTRGPCPGGAPGGRSLANRLAMTGGRQVTR